MMTESLFQKNYGKFNYDGISYPTTFGDIIKFEGNNGVSIFVYGIGSNGKIVKEREMAILSMAIRQQCS